MKIVPNLQNEADEVIEFVPKIPLSNKTPEQLEGDMEVHRNRMHGCNTLALLQIMGCHNITVKAVIDLLLNLTNLSYLGYDKIGEVFKSSSIFEANKIYAVQNFEQTVSHMENLEGNINHVVAHQDFVEKLSNICPRLKTVKLNINKDNDDYVKHLVKIKELEEVIIDYPGSMGLGFHSFLTHSGSGLTQLGLTLRELKVKDIQLISKECENLRILHLFFANFIQDTSPAPDWLGLPNLEGLKKLPYLLIGSWPQKIHANYCLGFRWAPPLHGYVEYIHTITSFSSLICSFLHPPPLVWGKGTKTAVH